MRNLALLFVGIMLTSTVFATDENIYQPSKDLANSIANIQQQAEADKSNLDKIAQPSEDQIAQAKKPDAKIGMTKYQVAQETKWGNPYNVNKTTTKSGLSEQWVYSRGYLYFENNKLVAIQER